MRVGVLVRMGVGVGVFVRQAGGSYHIMEPTVIRDVIPDYSSHSIVWRAKSLIMVLLKTEIEIDLKKEESCQSTRSHRSQ